MGSTTVTWTVTDNAGLQATATQIVTITDNILPTITAIVDRNENIGASCSFTIPNYTGLTTASDNCTAVASITKTQSPAIGTVLSGHNTTQLIIITANDGNGNTQTTTFTITLKDVTNPTILVGINQTANTAAGLCSASVTVLDATFGDNCTGVTLTYTLSGATIKTATSGQVGTHTFNKGVTTINYTVTDVAGNSTTGSKTIEVKDNENPNVITLPDLSAECSLTVTPPTTTDNCDGTITGTTGVSLTFNKNGTEIIYWTFTDSSGNSIVVQQNVTINDITEPEPSLTSLPNITIIGCQISNIGELPNPPTATDNCDGSSIQGALSTGFVFPWIFSGTQTIDWQFVDSNGNIAIQSQNITLTPIPVSGGTLQGTFEATVFSNQIDISSCGTAISIELNLSGENGTIVRWEKFAENNGIWVAITDADGDNHKHTASFPIGGLVSTYYRVLVQTGTCSEYSNQFYVRALPAGDAPTVERLDPDEFYCLGDQVNLNAKSNYSATGVPGIPNSSGDFNQGQLNTQDPNGWLVDGDVRGFTAGGSATKPRNWSAKTCGSGANGIINYCGGDGKYAIAYGNYYETDKKGKPVYDGNIPTTLETPIFDLSNALSASLDFDQAYYFSNNDYAIIEVSIDGGVTYSTLRLMHGIGTGVKAWFTDPTVTAAQKVGATATNYNFKNDNTSISLAAYIGQSNVRIRWSFTGTTDQSTWAMDNIFVNKEEIVETDIEWTDGIGDPNVPPIAGGATEVPISFIPDAPGFHQYGGTALINGCRTYDSAGTALIDIYVSYSYAGEPVVYTSEECGQNTVQLNAYDNRISATLNAAKGTFVIPPGCINCDDPGTGDEGVWSISDNSICGGGSFSDINDPNALFTGEAGTYTLTWTVNGCGSNVTVTTTNCNKIDFDGDNDYVDFNNTNFHLDNGAFSIETWVKPESIAGTYTIFSKRDANFSGSAQGYDLRIANSGEVSFNWDKTGTINSSPYKINTNRWYHIAITRTTSAEYRLYIDGVLIKTQGGPAPKVNNNKAILGAMDSNGAMDPINYFNGWMDEVRIWDVALTLDQLRQMMNQKIISSPTVAGNVQGVIIPIDINGLSWSSLKGYYQMEPAYVACGYLNSTTGLIKGKLKNITSDEEQTAPIPYVSGGNGSWTTMSTWAQPSVWDFPNSTGINGAPINWNIVRTTHNITSGARDITVLGLLSDSGELTMSGVTGSDGTGTGQGLWITHYLKLNGVIDLEGESQLVQKRYIPAYTPEQSESIFDASSSGYIERDQQGKKSSFNYNYWSSPVSPRGATNNAPYSVGSVLKYGTLLSSQVPVIFGDGAYFADGSNGTNIKISNRWIYSYNSTTVGNTDWQNYYQWNYKGSTGSIGAGEGFSMKGTGGAASIATLQNYVFEGKPHSGTISLSMIPGRSYLIGNPYPSAIDADEFILDNLAGRASGNIFNGALYFWDHFVTGKNHILAEYEGGYATYTLMGSVVAKANLSLGANTLSTGSKLSKRYIPVGQGFFVNGTLDPKVAGTVAVAGGFLVFKNSQRIFVSESSGSSIFLKSSESKGTSTLVNDSKYVDSRPKIRLQFDSPLGYRRGLLVGVDDRTTNEFDIGFDAPLNEDSKEDMFWQLGKGKLVIQGVNNFNKDQELPLGLKIDKTGLASIKIEALENIDEGFELYIKDSFTGETYKINKQPFEINLEPGEYLDRFALVFQPRLKTLSEIKLAEGIFTYMNNRISELQIAKIVDTEITDVTLFNYLGQTVKSWNSNFAGRKLSLPINAATGVYIVQINTINGTVNKKIIIE
ncbi:LamG-like jellyroll fold domain-containing protein [Lutibacter sp.]|uniref:LamG-like jellyroll fold domain-containing protein n=1 Tax=Lutibacter sp. TaxID=1925666 RepID=UPI002736548A|nr:LamG-like jellyroll fold domain-containing protein [Lutibacter sp.]MDP3312702.1 LamG-like jellyroll fold domain-containing protein [Lutibacter sp.]